MVEYYVMLKRNAPRLDVCVFRDEDREVAIKEMFKYDQHNGFTIQDKNGRFTIRDIVLVEREPVYGAPIISETSYHEIFDVVTGKRK